MQEKKIQLGSGELTYFQAGHGRPLLWLHPAGGVRRSKVLAGLAQSFALHVPVFPGFEGTSFHAGVSTRRALGGLAAEFLWLALERPQLVERRCSNARRDW